MNATLTRAAVDFVLTDVWTNFFAWKRDYARAKLASLAEAPPPTTRSVGGTPDKPQPLAVDGFISISMRSPSLYYDDLLSTSATLEPIIIPLPESSLEPYPEYECIAPIARSIYVGDDSDDMPFIPFSDDPTFDHGQHMTAYSSLSWQGSLSTHQPTLDLIAAVTIYRLRRDLNITLEEIKINGALPPILSLSRSAMRRDFPPWPAIQEVIRDPAFPSFLYTKPTPGNDFTMRLEALNAKFCPNLSCIETHCTLHDYWNKPPQPILARVKAQDTPCSPDCHLIRGCTESAPNIVAHADPSTLDDIRAITRLVPTISSCDLAALVRLPCYQAFKLREQEMGQNVQNLLNMLTKIADASSSETLPAFSEAPTFAAKDPSKFVPNEPCYHDGPCTTNTLCVCSQNLAHCERNCRCSSTCERRFRGCDCVDTKQNNGRCANSRCPCVEAGRECDPEICGSCQSRDAELGSCKNSQIQRGSSKNTTVRPGMSGLGLFLEEAVIEGDLITEYVGELIAEATVDSRDDVATHRGRGYVFGMNAEYSVDASYAGNAARFINHAPKSKANCVAQVKLVNGDHRIGIYATHKMAAGRELLLDYGPEFFVHAKHRSYKR